MRKLFLSLVALLSIGGAYSFANYTMTQGAGTTFGSAVVGGFHYVQMFICDVTTPAQCAAVSAAGAQKVDGSAVTQPVSGTFWQTTQPISGLVTANPGTAANWGIGSFGSAMIANGQAVGLYDGTNMVRARGDETSGIWVNIKAGAGSGGTALADGAAFTQGTTNDTPVGCLYATSVTNLTAGQAGVVRCTNDRQLMVSDAALLAAASAPLATQGQNVAIGGVGILGTAASGSNGAAVSSNGEVLTRFGPAAPVVQGAAAATLVLKSSAGSLFSVNITIGATSGYLMLFDATAAPADGAVTPKLCRYVKSDATSGATALQWNNPLTFATGISAAFSSTGCFTKTAATAAFIGGQVQ